MSFHKEPNTYKINYFTPERRAELISKGFVLDQEIKLSEETQTDKSLIDVYEKTKAEYLGFNCNTSNCQNYKTHISKKPLHTYFADQGKYIEHVTKNGHKFQCFEIPSNIKMYKGTKYFYKDYPPNHFWVGCQKLAMDYAEWYGGGLNIYINSKPLKLMVLNKENLEKIYKDAKSRGAAEDIEAMDLLGMIYGIYTSIEDQTAWICKKNPQWCGKIWLYDEHDCDRHDPKPNQYMPVWGSNLIHDYFYKYYDIDGTFLEYFISPFRDICDEEISINIKQCGDSVSMDKEDPSYWENWGLSLPPDNEFMLNESYPSNIGFKVNNWYQSNINYTIPELTQGDVRILTYNVRYLTSANILRTENEILSQLISIINKSNSHIIFIQEFPMQKIQELRSLKNHQLIYTQNGGRELLLVALVNLNKSKFTKFDIIKDHRRTIRNSILLNYVHQGTPIKIIGTHLEIGRRYMKNTRFIAYSDFYNTYKKNTNTRIDQLKFLTSKNPDILIGDFNFNPADPEMEYIDKLGLTHFDTPTTSIHSKKVDFAFFNSINIIGKEHPIDYFESDHKPLIFDFNTQKNKKSGGTRSYQFDTNVSLNFMFNFAIFCSIIIILLVILLYFMIPVDEKNYSNLILSSHKCLITE